MHVTQHYTWMKKSVCIKLQLDYNIIHHFGFVFLLYFFYHSSCRKDQFTVLRLKFGTIALDYEQSLFFLSPSSKTRETVKRSSSWLKVRDWRSGAAALVFPVSRLRRSRACTLLPKSEEKERLLAEYNSWVARDVTKNPTKKLSILLSFYFHGVLEYLNIFT